MLLKAKFLNAGVLEGHWPRGGGGTTVEVREGSGGENDRGGQMRCGQM